MFHYLLVQSLHIYDLYASEITCKNIIKHTPRYDSLS